MKSFEEFERISSDPHGYAWEMKRQGKTLLGYFCSYTPEEIIHAAGIHPLRLFGAKEDLSLADKHLQTYCCSLARGALADVLGGTLDYLDGAVFPHTCDTIQRLSDIWRLNTHFRFFADVVLPVKLNSDSALRYMEDVLRKFRRDLEEGFGLKITDEALARSIRTYNSIRSLLKKIAEIRSGDAGKITAGDLHSLVKASMVLDRDRLVSMLSGVLGSLEAPRTVPGNTKKRIMLAGSICDHPDIYALLERAGAEVVWEDMCTGARYFEGAISEEGDPIAAIAARYFGRAICPAKHASVTARGENLVKQAKDHDVQGVVFLQLKFCDPHSFDYPYLKEFLDRETIPNMLLEIEDKLPAEGQLLTRFETFVEML
jgi:bzd-type benzoyl-CoA reductase N subunit